MVCEHHVHILPIKKISSYVPRGGGGDDYVLEYNYDNMVFKICVIMCEGTP